MTNNIKVQSRANAAAVRVAEWLIPPVLIPALLAIMIGIRAVYLVYAG